MYGYKKRLKMSCIAGYWGDPAQLSSGTCVKLGLWGSSSPIKISSYATMHPWEDWAETWAHFLHLTDTLDTAEAAGTPTGFPLGNTQPTIDPTPFEGIAGATTEEASAFAEKTLRWCGVVVLANELSRSMGQPDIYPFSQSLPVLQKLFFIERVIHGNTGATS